MRAAFPASAAHRTAERRSLAGKQRRGRALAGRLRRHVACRETAQQPSASCGGADVVKALGAYAVMTGRVCAYGLGLGGEDGVRHVLRSLRHDFELTMRLAGFASLADLGPEVLARRPLPETAARVNQELAAHPGRKRATRAHGGQPGLKLAAFTLRGGGGRGAGSVN
jgi:hypothetical protein